MNGPHFHLQFFAYIQWKLPFQKRMIKGYKNLMIHIITCIFLLKCNKNPPFYKRMIKGDRKLIGYKNVEWKILLGKKWVTINHSKKLLCIGRSVAGKHCPLPSPPSQSDIEFRQRSCGEPWLWDMAYRWRPNWVYCMECIHVLLSEMIY